MQTSLIKEGIKYTYDLFKDKSVKIIYLADRWSTNNELMKYIEDLGAIYCIRVKGNMIIYIYDYGEMLGKIKEIKGKEKEEQYYKKVLVTKNKYRTSMVVSKKEGHEEIIYVLTNGEVEKGITRYSYRFGSIECIFKNQKSNGFYLESTKVRNIQAFKTLFGLMCVSLLWLTLLGVEYTIKGNKNKIKIRWSRKRCGETERMFSLFNTGLIYFNLCFNSHNVPKITCRFILYEI